MKVKCTRPGCENEWEYTGMHPYFCNCPKCMRRIYFGPKGNSNIKDKPKIKPEADPITY